MNLSKFHDFVVIVDGFFWHFNRRYINNVNIWFQIEYSCDFSIKFLWEIKWLAMKMRRNMNFKVFFRYNRRIILLELFLNIIDSCISNLVILSNFRSCFSPSKNVANPICNSLFWSFNKLCFLVFFTHYISFKKFSYHFKSYFLLWWTIWNTL